MNHEVRLQQRSPNHNLTAVPVGVDNVVSHHQVTAVRRDTVQDPHHITATGDIQNPHTHQGAGEGEVAAVDIEAGVTGVGTIMEAVMTTTIAVVMVGTEATEVETTVILIKAAPTAPVGTMTITTEDVEAVVEAGGVAAVATMEVAVGVEAVGVTTIMAMMMTALIGMAKRINFQIIWNTFPQKTTPWLPEPCSPEISNLISLTRKSNAFLADMAICSTLTSNVRPQGPGMPMHSFVTRI